MRLIRLFPLLLLLSFLSPSNVRADTITLTLGGASFTALGDTVSLSPNTVTLNLTAGVPLTANIQTGDLFITPSPGSATFMFTLSRPATINGVMLTASQAAQLVITPAVDTLTLSNGPTLTFDLGAGGLVDFTPLGLTRPATTLGSNPFTVQGTFLLRDAAAIPEPTTLLLLSTGLAGVGAAVHKRRRANDSEEA